MAIAEQFAGLQMDKLIGAPLRAAADASTQLAHSTAEFIKTVGFEDNGKVRTVAFGYQRRSTNEDGTSNLDEMKVDIPLLAIVPIPNLQVDEVNVLFDMEVKQSERQESEMDMSASLTGTVNFGIIKVSVTGSVSAHQSNTRSSDNSAKYHVDVRATNHGTPEGLARVLDMMAANVAPMLVGSSLKDGNGQSLSDKAKEKAERLKTLRQEISKIENSLSAAQDGLSSSLIQLKRVASSQLNVYRETISRLQNAIGREDFEKQLKEASTDEQKALIEEKRKAVDEKALAYTQTMDSVNQSFGTFQNQAGEFIKMIVDSGSMPEGISEMFALKAVDKDGNETDYSSSETYYAAMVTAQKGAINNQNNVSRLENELFEKKAQYSDEVAGRAPALPVKKEN